MDISIISILHNYTQFAPIGFVDLLEFDDKFTIQHFQKSWFLKGIILALLVELLHIYLFDDWVLTVAFSLD